MMPRFKEYDRDGNGYVSLDEATSILQSAPFNFPASKVGHLLTKFDKDGNGKLDIEEFADFYAEAKGTYVTSLSINQSKLFCNARNVVHKLESEARAVASGRVLLMVIEKVGLGAYFESI